MKLFDPKNKIWWLVIFLFIIVILSQLFSNVKENLDINTPYSKVTKIVIKKYNWDDYLHLNYIELKGINDQNIGYTATNAINGANYENKYPLDYLTDSSNKDRFYHSNGYNDTLTITPKTADYIKYIKIVNRNDSVKQKIYDRIKAYGMIIYYENGGESYINFNTSPYSTYLTSSNTGYGFTLELNMKGDTGSKGGVGPQGSVGNQGRIGDSGVKGLQGDQGPQGDKGLLGNQGIQGGKGLKGVDGPEGDVGPAGVGSSVQTANENFTVMNNYSNIMNSLSTPAYL